MLSLLYFPHKEKIRLEFENSLWPQTKLLPIKGLPDVQARLRKGKGTRDQIANIHWIIEKAREFQKNIYFCLVDYDKAFNCVDHSKLKSS